MQPTKKFVALSVKCPHCYNSLMDEKVLLNDHPSVKINIVTATDRGTIRLCSLYECFDHQVDIEIADREVVDFYCPHCNKHLNIKDVCDVCSAPMVVMVLSTGGKVYICSRKGCSNHQIAFDNIGTELTNFYQEYGYGF